jgi:hypothetical protein
MPPNTFLNTTGSQAWDVAANWSRDAVPSATDDVVYTAPANGSSSVGISARAG